MTAVRALVVDDSPTMRSLISAALRRDPDIEVVGTAGDPHEARAAIKSLNPDVITLDIEMPGMNGLEFLEKIMRLRPMPVVMVSTLTQLGAEATLQALELGAVDCVAKPTGSNAVAGLSALSHKVKAAAAARVRSPTSGAAPLRAPADYQPNGAVVAVGASTGGVEALLKLVSAYPARCPPTLITQHMPASFTASFAARLDRGSAASVAEAYDGAPVEAGRVWLAPGGVAHLELGVSAGRTVCRLREGEAVSGHRPSVDVLFASVAAAAGRAVGVILTGMGRDGAAGLLAMRQAGARTLGQDAASCVVYGMPKSAFELGAVERQHSIETMSRAVLELAGRGN